MPKKMEEALKKTAKKRGYSKERTGAFVYGTMYKAGKMPSKAPKPIMKSH